MTRTSSRRFPARWGSPLCDTVMALTGKREEVDSILKTSSRDFEATSDIVLRFDKGTWIVAGTDLQAYAE